MIYKIEMLSRYVPFLLRINLVQYTASRNFLHNNLIIYYHISKFF